MGAIALLLCLVGSSLGNGKEGGKQTRAFSSGWMALILERLKTMGSEYYMQR